MNIAKEHFNQDISSLLNLKRTKFILYLGITLIIAIGRMNTYVNTGHADAQLFDYFGERLLNGDKIYKDIWDIKPPGIFYVNAALNYISPHSFAPHAVTEFFLLIITSILLFKIVLSGTNTICAYCSVYFFSMLSALHQYNEGGNLTELYVVFFMVLSIFLFTNFTVISSRFFSGFCVAISTFFKLNGASLILVIPIYIFIEIIFFKRKKGIMLSVLVFLVGFVSFWIAIFFTHEDFYELVRVSFYYPFQYSVNSISSISEFLVTLEERVEVTKLMVWFLVYGFTFSLILMFRRSSNARENTTTFILIFGWALSDVLGVVAGGRLYGHYFMLSFASISALVGYVIFNKNLRLISVFFLFSSMYLISLQALKDFKWSVFPALMSHEIPSREVNTIVQCIEYLSSSNSYMYVVPYKPLYYNQLDLPSASRFTTTVNLRDSRDAEHYIASVLLRDLHKNMPDFIINSENISLPELFNLKLANFIDEHYISFIKFNEDVLYLKKSKVTDGFNECK